MTLTWTERARTAGDGRLWVIARGEPDEHPISSRYPARRLHRVAMSDLEEHWQLDGAIVGSGLKLVEVVRDDGEGGHVWFEEIPGWQEPTAPPAARPEQPAKRSHHKRRA